MELNLFGFGENEKKTGSEAGNSVFKTALMIFIKITALFPFEMHFYMY